MSAPKLTRDERRAVAERYQDGESMPELAESYGVYVGVIERALKQQGVERRGAIEARQTGRNVSLLNLCRECKAGCHPNAVKPLCPTCARDFCRTCDKRLPADWNSRECHDCRWAKRYAKRAPRLCRVCGRMGARASKRDLCNVHIRHYCRICEAPLPPTRVATRCTACENEKKQRMYAKPGRKCALCGEREVTAHASRCQHCVHEDYEIRRWALMHLDRPCVECGVTLPRGRQVNRCAKCQGKRVRQIRRRHQAIGAHRCALCAEPLAISHGTYCNGCTRMLANWRASWHAGCKVARMLGTVRTQQRRWQEAKS
jgi:hypothetical protein